MSAVYAFEGILAARTPDLLRVSTQVRMSIPEIPGAAHAQGYGASVSEPGEKLVQRGPRSLRGGERPR